jgi:hypothetical protein
MNASPKNMPLPLEAVVDQRQLNGESAWAYRHELGVSMRAETFLPDPPWPVGEPGDTATWTELEEMPDGSTILRVVLVTSASRLTDVERGIMTGELAEAWWWITSP